MGSRTKVLVDFHYVYYNTRQDTIGKINSLASTECNTVILWMNYDWLNKTFGADGQRKVAKFLKDNGIIYDSYMINAQSDMTTDILAVFNEDYVVVLSNEDFAKVPCLQKSFSESFSFLSYN